MAMTDTPVSDLQAKDVQAADAESWLPLEVYDLTKTWKKTKNLVLDGVEMSLEPGSVTWIAGRNGAGKTTLLRILAGLIGAEQGMVRAFGLHPERDRRAYQQRVGFLSAGNTGIYARLTVRQQLDTWARIAFVPREVRAEGVEAAVTAFELDELGDRRSDRLSLGQRQRLRLAMTFVAQPDLVLLDEPATSLDGEGGEVLARAIATVAARGGACLWVTPTGDSPKYDFTTHLLLEAGKLREVDR
jgi:ABC-2 type transport system ATP-binding protein